MLIRRVEDGRYEGREMEEERTGRVPIVHLVSMIA
jgi:hypothetical protein